MLFLRTLGGVSLSRDDRALDGAATQRRRLALLTLLAAAGERGVSRDKLVALLWPDSEEEKARHTLSQWLFLLRKDLREPDLIVGTTELRLDPTRLSFDAGEFERAIARGDREGALTSYRGPFLDGFFVSEAAEFERWADDERARLERAAQRAAEELAGECAAHRDAAGAVRWWEWLATRDRLSARVALGYMQALAAAGEHDRAIRHARVHEEIVRQELEGEPDARVAAFARTLQSSARQLPAPALPTHAPTSPALQFAADTVERARAARRSAPVRLSDVGAAVETRAPETEERGARDGVAGRRRTPWRRSGRNVLGGALAAAILLGLVGSDRGESDSVQAPLVLVADFRNEARDSALDPLGRLAAHWIARGLGDAGLVEVTTMDPDGEGGAVLSAAELRRRALAAGATAIVTGAYYAYGDSLVMEARIVEAASGRVLRTVGPTTTSRAQPIAGLEGLRQRTMGALAISVDSLYAPSATSMVAPPSYEAFRELAAGDEDAGARRWQAALGHYRRAAALDSSYLSPLVRATSVLRDSWRCTQVDSVRRLIESRRVELGDLDALTLRANMALCRGDIAQAYETQKRVVQLVPASDRARYTLANLALRLNRPHEVVRILDRLDLHRAPLRAAPQLYLDYTMALHMLGRHERELEMARDARATHPTSVIPYMCEARALAVLGRVDEVRRVVAASLLVRPWQGWNEPDVFVTAADELEAHGHREAATRLRTELVDWLRTHETENRDQERARVVSLAVTLGLLGRHVEAVAAMDSLDGLSADIFERVIVRGRLAALRGDSATAESLADSLARLRVDFPQGIPTYGRAQIAALLGQRERAAALLRESIASGIPYTNTREGKTRGFSHVLPEFRTLHGLPAYEGLLRPRE